MHSPRSRPWNRTCRIRLIFGVAALVTAGVRASGAWPTTSPSAREAARLKYHPPANWIRHYLPDDRYKVAGLWKFVSTQYDTFYHRANCPNMLRQPADIVIGFYSAKDAREAGYRPDNTCAPDAGAAMYATAIVTSTTRHTSVTTVNRGSRPTRITLADRQSTILLPPNWRRTQTGANAIAGYAGLSDTLQPQDGRGLVQVHFVQAPAGLNVATLMTPATFNGGFAQVLNSPKVTPEARRILQNSTATSATVGGMPGLRVSGPNNPGRVLYITARGSKVYMINMPSNSSAQAILRSFQPR